LKRLKKTEIGSSSAIGRHQLLTVNNGDPRASSLWHAEVALPARERENISADRFVPSHACATNGERLTIVEVEQPPLSRPSMVGTLTERPGDIVH